MSNKLKSMKRKVKNGKSMASAIWNDYIAEVAEEAAEKCYQCGLTNKAMFYQCDNCGHKILIWLELGLEEHRGDVNKPVPYGVRCPACGDYHMYHVDWKNDIHTARFTEIPNHSYYFANIKSMECGVLKYKE